MKPGSLSEQMGAMAAVDALRLQQRQVQEHLDLPQRRAEVVERIRGHYQHQGIACDDALIDQGVREFFARRLAFEAPPLNGWRRLLAGACLHRSIGVSALALLLVVGAAYALQHEPAAAPGIARQHTGSMPAAARQPAPELPAEHYARLDRFDNPAEASQYITASF